MVIQISILNGCLTKMEFESTWNGMIEKHNLKNHA